MPKLLTFILMFCLCIFSVYGQKSAYTVPYMPEAPIIDGKLTDHEWETAAAGLGLTSLTSGFTPEQQTVFYIGYDDKFFYFAATIPIARKLQSNCKQNDGTVFEDDSIELYIDGRNGKILDAMTQFESDEYRHFIVNSENTRYDGIGRSPQWNGKWKSAVWTGKDMWSVELAVPWKDLNLSKPPQKFGLAVGWNDISGTHQNYSWPADTYHKPSRFADISLTSGPALRLTDFIKSFPDKIVLTAGLSKQGKAKLTLNGKDVQLGKTPKAIELGLNKENKTEVKLKYESPKLGNGEFVFNYTPGIAIKTEKYYFKGEVIVTVMLNSTISQHGKWLELFLLSPDGNKKLVHKLKLNSDKRFELKMNTQKLRPGNYSLLASIRGTELKGTTPLRIIKPPVWLGNHLGEAEDKVLPPWQPIKTTGQIRHISLRDYTLGASLFPMKIKSLNETLLNAPVKLILTVDGQQVDIQKTVVKNIINTPARIKWQGKNSNQFVKVIGTTIFDYDGVWFTSFKLTPMSHLRNRKVSLQLDIPLSSDAVKYYYTFFANWHKNVFHPLKKGIIKLPFIPLIWIGSEKSGLTIFSESDQFWTSPKESGTIELVNSGEEFLLRYNLLKETLLTGPVKYNIGFQATPVVKRQTDTWSRRVERFGSTTMADAFPARPGRIRWMTTGKITSAGSIELDFKPEFATDGIEAQRNQNLLNLQNSPKDRLFIFWSKSDKRLKMFFMENGKIPVILTSKQPLRENAWNTVKVTWGQKVVFTVNGKVAGSNKYIGFPGKSTSSSSLTLGSWNADYIVDNLSWRDGRGNIVLEENFDDPANISGEIGGGAKITETDKGGILALSARYAKPVSRLDTWKKRGTAVVQFHEQWTPVQDGFVAVEPTALRKVISAIKAKNMTAILYFGFQLSNINPWFEDFKNECLVNPVNGGFTRKKPAQYAKMVCYKSAWQDYLVWAVDHVMKEYGAGGIYLDATGYVWPCNNRNHGCGYIDKKGVLHPTYPFMAVRNLMRRLYTVVMGNNPNGVVDFHNSTTMITPSTTWTTSNWVGEEFTVHHRKPGFFFEDITSLDNLRMNMSWKHFGIPTDFLNYVNNPFTFKEALALSLIHGVLTRPENNIQKDEVFRIVKIRQKYLETGKAVWHPYWQKPIFNSLPSGVKISCWIKKDDSILAVVANLSRKPVIFDLIPNRNVTGLAAPLHITDQLTAELIKDKMKLDAMEFRIVKVEMVK